MKKQLAVAALALAIGACHSEKITSEPGPLNGKYALVSINGVALPAPADLSGMSAIQIIADTITIDADGFGDQKTVIATALATGPRTDLRTLQVWPDGPVKFSVEYPCPDFAATSAASCLAPPHFKGVVSASGMTFNYSVIYRTPMVYKRLP